MKYLKRFLALPFVMAITGIASIWQWGAWVINFIRHGGEFITYTDKRTPATLQKVMEDFEGRIYNTVDSLEDSETDIRSMIQVLRKELEDKGGHQ